MILGENVTNWRLSQWALIFLLKPLENAFFECLHTTYIERTHMGTLYYELGHENENKPRSGQVAWGHRNMRLCPKIHQQYLLSWPFTFSIYVNTNQCQKYHQNDGNMKNSLLASKIGILPILQECPWSRQFKIMFFLQDACFDVISCV